LKRLFYLQKRDNHRSRFVFAFYGVFNPELWREQIDLQSATIAQDNRGLKYAFIKTKEKRASEIKSHLNRYDRDAPDSMKVKLTTIAGYESIISFGKGEDPTKHSIYKTMMKYSNSARSVKWEREGIMSSSGQYTLTLLDGGSAQHDGGDRSSSAYSGISDENSMDSVSSSGSALVSRLMPLLAEQIREEFQKEKEENRRREELLREELRKEREERRTHEQQLRDEMKSLVGTKLDGVLEEIKTNTSAVMETRENTVKLMEKQAEIQENVQDIAAGQEIMAASVVAQEAKIDEGNSLLQEVADSQVEALYLRRDLDATKEILDKETAQKRSIAAKLAAQSRKLNKAVAKIIRMEVERLETVENSAVITSTRQIGNQVDSIASQLGISVPSPFGNLDHMGPYTAWMEQNGYDAHFQAYKTVLDNRCKLVKPLIRRSDLLLVKDYSEISKIRLFVYGLSILLNNIQDNWNLDNSPAKQRFNLTVYGCPIFSAQNFEEVRNTMETQVKYFSNQLSLDYVRDETVYPSIKGDAFQIPEVSLLYIHLAFMCLLKQLFRCSHGNWSQLSLV
jgi:hypothetical protein